VGFGRIGQAVCAKARGLGLRVLAHDAYVPADVIAAHGAELVDLDTLLGRSDFVSLHAPLSAGTERIIDARALALMQPATVLINTARGPLIDEEALLAAVRAGRIAGAALDVLAVEPPPPDHPFFAEERIWITPHAGWYSASSLVDAVEGASENIALVLQGGQPRTPVNVPNLAARRWSS
jgi:D-3-phosphoglycerate dehydrogenase / 2-oxoglutarate reductase